MIVRNIGELELKVVYTPMRKFLYDKNFRMGVFLKSFKVTSVLLKTFSHLEQREHNIESNE
jgi:hypothetical protein